MNRKQKSKIENHYGYLRVATDKQLSGKVKETVKGK